MNAVEKAMLKCERLQNLHLDLKNIWCRHAGALDSTGTLRAFEEIYSQVGHELSDQQKNLDHEREIASRSSQ